MISRQPRIAVLGKHRSIVRWFDDFSEGLTAAAANALPIDVRPDLIVRCKKSLGNSKNLRDHAGVLRIARQLQEFDPELVICLGRSGLTESETEFWRASLKTGVPIIGWTCDHFTSLRADERAALDGVYYFDSASEAGLRRAYAGKEARIQYLPLAANPRRYAYAFVPVAERIPRACFAGFCSRERLQFLDEYRASGGEVEVFGPHCRDYLRPWRSRRLPAETLAHLYRSHIACINIVQATNTVNGLNLRAFEIPASGGLGLYPDVPDVASCFVPGSEILLYRTLEELKEIIAGLIAHPDKAAAIIEAGAQRVLREHTWQHRAARILQDWLPTEARELDAPSDQSVCASA